MLHSSTSPLSSAGGVPVASETIHSRFGEVVIDLSKIVEFPRGLLGMPGMVRFALAGFPSERMQQFMLLQSLDDKSLSFITLPLPAENPVIVAEDVREAIKELQINEQNLVMLLIVSVHRSLAEVKLSANARAPIFIDSSRRTGVQHVFQNDQYKVQHML
jgi:flagellar assembly factor FliW